MCVSRWSGVISKYRLYMDIIERYVDVFQYEKYQEVVYDYVLWEAAYLEWMTHRREIWGGRVDKGS